jgi:tetratricopeptide (TPR) repeat protein
LDEAEAFLEAGEGARAVVAFSRLAGRGDLSDEVRHQVLLGLAHAHEQVGDFESARSAYQQVASEDPDAADVPETWARRGAVEAELEDWAQSAQSFERAYAGLAADALVSLRIEWLARRAYAQFNAGELEACGKTLDEAEQVYAGELENPTERFSTYYFVGMMRFYRAAIIHRRFRDVEVQLPEARMAKDFERKLQLLTQAQEAYNETIRVKHVFWVSAAGYQLGTLFEEFYDDLMHAPVPDWLDEAQKQTYYEELKGQLRPVVNKAIWVFEKNLESARRIGYENPFVEQTREALARLQSILLDSDSNLGSPHPRLATPIFADGGEPTAEGQDSAIGPLDRKLHLPTMTSL